MSTATRDRLHELIGVELPPSRWIGVDQSRIDAFADCTEDHQSIHVDADLAAASPFGVTVAHGFLTLSLVIPLWNDVVPLDSVSINYGLDRVRFPAPVPAGSRVRGRFVVRSVDDVAGGVQVSVDATVEREGADKPVCVAILLLRVLD